MKSIKSNYVRVILVIILSISICTLGCKRNDDKPSTPEPKPFPLDSVIKYDPLVDGVFEGDSNAIFPNDLEPELNLMTSFKNQETNSVSAEAIKSLPEFGIDDFGKAYEDVISRSPGIDKNSNEFAEKIMEQLRLTSSTVPESNLRTLAVLDTWNRLTPAERELVIRNPVKAYNTKGDKENAERTTVVLFGENGYQNRSDAFRHCYWNWLMCKSSSIEWATAFGNAHEGSSPNDDDTRMDLNNNMVGRRIFSSNPSASEQQAQSTLLNHKLLWLNQIQKNVIVGIDYLVYLVPLQSLTVFDDGPDFDDIFNISWDGGLLGTTPAGGSRAFEFSQIASGTYNLNINCTLDGTKGGCGFQIIFKGAINLSSGQSQSPQIVIEESNSHVDKVTFPTLNEKRKEPN